MRLKIGLVCRTLRHLGTRQILARFLRPLRRCRLYKLSSSALAPRRSSGAAWIPGRTRARQWIDANTFSIFGETRPPAASRLWTYHRHYYDDLADPRDRALEQRLIATWIESNPAARGPGWEPYPLSRRIVNWIIWLQIHKRLAPPGAIASLAQQARALSRQIEYDLRANHLWTNGKALVFAGCFFSGAEANHWLGQGLKIIQQELAEQVLPDGGHIERSPLYHALFLEDLLDLINLAGLFPDAIENELCERLTNAAIGMLAWLRTMSRADGTPCGFGDTAAGSAPPGKCLDEYAYRLGIRASPSGLSKLLSLGSSRYVRIEQSGTTVWFDRGGPAPDYQPGHSHAAALSFELEFAGQPAIVNPGISTYQEGSTRSWERSTAAHNTLRLDGRDQSEMWGAFRVGRRARTIHSSAGIGSDCLWVTASHDGYHPVVHSRRIEVADVGARLRILDHLSGPPSWHGVEIYFYLAPGWEADCDDGGQVAARHPVSGRSIRFTIPDELAAWIEPASLHPDFGATIPTRRIRLFAPVEVSPAGLTLVTSIQMESYENSLLRRQLSAREECASLAGF